MRLMDVVLAGSPDQVDALVSRAYVTASAGELAAAFALAERAVAADPEDPNARLIRASLAAVQDAPDTARADLDALAQMPRPTASFLLGSPAELARAIDEGLATTTTTTSPGATSTGDGSRIPNPDGG